MISSPLRAETSLREMGRPSGANADPRTRTSVCSFQGQ